MKTVLIISLLFVSVASAATMSPPAIEWELLCPGHNYQNAMETSGGDLLFCGYEISTGEWNCLFCYDTDGSLLWEFSDIQNPHPSIYVGYAFLELQDGSFIVVGTGLNEEGSQQTSLALAKVSSTGERIWSKVYELENNSKSYGYDITQLPDGGFAICGDIDPAEGMNQAWILRTDSQGDTLWTREWGWEYNDKAMSVLYIDNGFTVLTQGRLQTTAGGPHLVRYDMDGNLLWEKALDLPHIGPALHAQDMCEASDNGLLILDNYHPSIYHTDYSGNYQWHFTPPGWGSNYGWSVSTTMDGGILFGGENAEYIPSGDSKTELSGMISRHDSEGNELWRDYVYNSGCIAIYSARQLSQGGYIAAGLAWSSENGNQGFLIKYAPETGIESGDVSLTTCITELYPNPFAATIGITFNLPASADVSITVYDLDGRVADNVASGVFPAGTSTVEWVAPDELSSGCYLVRLDTTDGHDVRNCILLR